MSRGHKLKVLMIPPWHFKNLLLTYWLVLKNFVANMFTRKVMSRITFVIIWISFMNMSSNGAPPICKVSLDYVLMILYHEHMHTYGINYTNDWSHWFVDDFLIAYNLDMDNYHPFCAFLHLLSPFFCYWFSRFTIVVELCCQVFQQLKL